MSLNKPKVSEQEVTRRDIEAKTLIHCARGIYARQVAGDRRCLRAHPVGAGSRTDEHVPARLRNPTVGTVLGHPRQYGQTARSGNGARLPVRTASRWMSSAPDMRARLGRAWQGEHRHRALVGGRAAAAAIYPP